jgi:hypothetical protein
MMVGRPSSVVRPLTHRCSARINKEGATVPKDIEFPGKSGHRLKEDPKNTCLFGSETPEILAST